MPNKRTWWNMHKICIHRYVPSVEYFTFMDVKDRLFQSSKLSAEFFYFDFVILQDHKCYYSLLNEKIRMNEKFAKSEKVKFYPYLGNIYF